MDYELDAIQARILGVLIEKQMATPDYYPMTLNALINACNQKTNRDPVMNLEQAEVEQALGALREHRLVWQVMTHGSRISKYEHNMKEAAEFSRRDLALLCELLLRGAQTAGELRARTARLTEFHGLAAVEHTLKKLSEHERGPFVIKLPRRPGHKENRYAHLFSEMDEAEITAEPLIAETGHRKENADSGPIDALEKRVNDLETELNSLREQFLEFKREFE